MTSPQDHLRHIIECANGKLPHLPKPVTELTPGEYEIFKIAAEAVGRMIFIRDEASSAFQKLKRNKPYLPLAREAEESLQEALAYAGSLCENCGSRGRYIERLKIMTQTCGG